METLRTSFQEFQRPVTDLKSEELKKVFMVRERYFDVSDSRGWFSSVKWRMSHKYWVINTDWDEIVHPEFDSVDWAGWDEERKNIHNHYVVEWGFFPRKAPDSLVQWDYFLVWKETDNQWRILYWLSKVDWELLLEPKYDWIRVQNWWDVISVCEDGSWFVINDEWEKISADFWSLTDFVWDYAVAANWDWIRLWKRWVIDKMWNIVINFDYDWISIVDKNWWHVYMNCVSWFLDGNYFLLKNNWANVRAYAKYWLADQSGKVIFDPMYDYLDMSDPNVIVVTKDWLDWLIDRDWNVVLEPQFDKIFPFDNWKARVIASDGTQEWLIDRTWKFIEELHSIEGIDDSDFDEKLSA